jgi:hypothetical protein
MFYSKEPVRLGRQAPAAGRNRPLPRGGISSGSDRGITYERLDQRRKGSSIEYYYLRLDRPDQQFSPAFWRRSVHKLGSGVTATRRQQHHGRLDLTLNAVYCIGTALGKILLLCSSVVANRSCNWPGTLLAAPGIRRSQEGS